MTGSHSHGLIVGKFYPLHAGHSALIRRAASECDTVTVQLLGSVAESIPLAVRESWLREEHPDVQVVAAYDEVPVDFDDPAIWDLHMVVINSLLDRPVDAVYTSDPYGAELARRLGADWVQVDPGRCEVPVSGRAIRADPGAYWWALAPCVRSWFSRRVVVLGAESTGTTTLAKQLAAHYGTTWVPEYGRTWSEVRPGGLSAPWESWEFDHIAARQAYAEDSAARTAPRALVICDTDVLATAVWHERYVGSTSPTVVGLARTRRPDLYLLTDCDVPFVQDGLRDGEYVREVMTARFREVLEDQPAPWVAISGSWDKRFASAVAAVDDLVAAPVSPLSAMMQNPRALATAGSARGEPMITTIDDGLADLRASAGVVALVRAVAAQRSVLADRRSNYLSIRPSPIRAIAFCVQSIDWRVTGPQMTLGKGHAANAKPEVDFCLNCYTAITKAGTCLCPE